MKEQICQAFCAQLHVDRVPAGWSVQTPYKLPDGDPVMFFIVSEADGNVHLEDDGATIAILEAAGAPMDKKGARYAALLDLLEQHDAFLDDDEGVIRTTSHAPSYIGNVAVGFTALMLRVHDLALLTVDRVKQSWQDDAMHDLHERFDSVGRVEENATVHPGVATIPADAVIRLPGGAPPVAVIMGTSNSKGLMALVLKMELEKYQGQNIPVILIVERAKSNPLSEGTQALAMSRLNGVHSYRGSEREALDAISRFVPAPETLQ